MRLFLALLNRNHIVPALSRPSSEDVVVKRTVLMVNASGQSTTVVVTTLARVQWREDFTQL
tara:strand:+ start:2458 stop:2640 length:183 start_codon:yes stop_codon:yes gene_type:complete